MCSQNLLMESSIFAQNLWALTDTSLVMQGLAMCFRGPAQVKSMRRSSLETPEAH